MKKRFLKYSLICLSLLTLLLGLSIITLLISRNVIANKNTYDYLNGESNKIILFIGDGMGENHIKIAEKALNKKFIFTNFKKQGYVSTFSKAIIGPTDSAAAATALATGNKVNNGEIAYHNHNNLTSISEEVKKRGYGVGIVTTDSLVGATPAAFSSHAKTRNDSDNIIKGQINSNIDLFLGAGYDTYINYKDSFINRGYSFINEFNELNYSNKKIIGAFNTVGYSNHSSSNPTLSLLVTYAVTYLEKNFPNGYFLMVEGAHIDKMSHDNNIKEMINYLNDFNTAIQLTHNKLKNDPHTSIIVTADHETGGLKYTNNINKINNNLYTRMGHTSRKVKYYIYSKSNKINNINKNIDNTDIYKICKALQTKHFLY